MAYKDLKAHQKITAVHLDIMKHPDFALMGGVTQIGKVHVASGFVELIIPTAGTDGCDVYYNETWVDVMTRKQLRYVVMHENFHKSLHHCTEYEHIREKYPNEFAQAIDYVTNDMIETMDPQFLFVERPTDPYPPLIDPRFHDMALPQVVKALLDEQKSNPKDPDGPEGEGPEGEGPETDKPGGKQRPGKGGKKPMDVHIVNKKASKGEGKGDEDGDSPTLKELKQQLTDAINQGAIVRNKLRGTGGGGQNLSGFQERTTDWRTPLRRFVQETCEGDDQSRFCPPNKRMLPLDILLPSHFSELTGELGIYCDTSGSMMGLYPTVFGEIARICQNALPASVRVIWWGDSIEGEQVFTPKDYDKISKLLSPKGGGGTTVSCVAKYVREKKYKPRASIYLTDGYVESSYDVVDGPVLWGVVDHDGWVPLKGKAIYISSVMETQA